MRISQSCSKGVDCNHLKAQLGKKCHPEMLRWLLAGLRTILAIGQRHQLLAVWQSTVEHLAFLRASEEGNKRRPARWKSQSFFKSSPITFFHILFL